MDKKAIHDYYNKLDQYQRFGGSRNETAIRRAFANLLEAYCLPKNLVLVDELTLKDSQKRPDGTVKDALRLDWGHWESKDIKDNLHDEIQKKIALGYPTFNIIFENSKQIVLMQQGIEVMNGDMRNSVLLHEILTQFVSYERPEISEFRHAIAKFKEDIPDIVESLRDMIAEQAKSNVEFRHARADFWQLCEESINPDITEFDIREMLIQHILTHEIFITIFDDAAFHRENNVAMQLDDVVNTFFTGRLRRNTLAKIDNYYKTIKREASNIANHHEKQKFLKVLYENFYQAYNPKGADRLGIVYTPNEIVRFMLESVDYLLDKHFQTSLHERDVNILDPTTGTGTFITDLIEYMPPQYLEYKYLNEIHANEVAILPYYIANLNIEYTYQQKMNDYQPFEHIVFVDTLDNLGFSFHGKQGEFEGLGMSTENLARIKEQNERQISVIIGNPPYNAKQQWYNDFNPNRKYEKVDERIRETYIKHGTAQNQNVVYDMYTRFYRWATDRINSKGIVALITNRSFVNARTFDGFRKTVEDEFDYIYIIDLNGDLRADPQQSAGNVFGIKTGVAIAFMVKQPLFDLHGNRVEKLPARIFYTSIFRKGLAADKLSYLVTTKLYQIPFERIRPDENYYWIDQVEHSWQDLIPICSKQSKKAKNGMEIDAIFKLFSAGVKTQRDDWAYDFSKKSLMKKMRYFVKTYRQTLRNEKYPDRNTIKWSADLTKYLGRRIKKSFKRNCIVESIYRPFIKKQLYFDKHFNGRTYQWFNMYRADEKNVYIAVSGVSSSKPFQCLAFENISSLDFIEKSQCLPLYYFDKDGTRHDNITDWALEQFRERYPTPNPSSTRKGESDVSFPFPSVRGARGEDISKRDIFHYVYAVLHDPAYREKYEINLKREFPRIPFYADFWKWTAWGKRLMDLHVNFEEVEPYPLKRKETPPLQRRGEQGKPKLKADKMHGRIILDSMTTLEGIPKIAWDYKLGNRSALEWVLDQYKEKKPRDKTIREKFNTYRFADYKEHVIDLLMRVCCVSVETMRIIGEMTGN